MLTDGNSLIVRGAVRWNPASECPLKFDGGRDSEMVVIELPGHLDAQG